MPEAAGRGELRLRICGAGLCAAIWLALGAVAAAQEEADREMLRALVEDIRYAGNPGIAGSALMAPSTVAAFYEEREFRPAWVDREEIARLVDLIELARSEGLDPVDYHWPLVQSMRGGDATATGTGTVTHVDRAITELVLTDALIVVLDHLRGGKVDPVQARAAWAIPEDEARQVLALAADVLGGKVGREPFARGQWFERLRGALESHRRIASAGGWTQIPDGPPMRPGDRDGRVDLLRQRLAESGDIEGLGGRPADDLYDGRLVAAVRRFQARHGLEADGTVGAMTLAALNVPVAYRIAQLRLTLERARWVIDELPDDFIVANIAGFRAYVVRDRTVVWDTRIVVGKPYQQTPVFADAIEYLVFNPEWVVPRSIALNEMLPAIRSDPTWFATRNFELRDRRGVLVDPASIDWRTVTRASFAWSLVQRPGHDNALGRVKFVFPNEYAVYLHDTPEKDLFGAASRTFSHGCIRVAEPLTLAEILLQPDGWDRAEVESAVSSGNTVTVHLSRHMPILVLYWTASVDPDGTVHFYRDVYGRDTALARALDEPYRSESGQRSD